MPEDALVGSWRRIVKGRHRQIRNVLRIEMNLVAVTLCKPLEDFSEGALRAMTEVHKGRKDSDTQVRSSLEQELMQWRGNLPGH